MGKDIHLINIYLKIHNKRALTMDDLQYLAKHSPECFEKTCKNVVYNIPETKPIMEPEIPESLPEEKAVQPEVTDREKIELILDNIKSLELDDLSVQKVSASDVKDLLGSLYMEMLFPHNDKTVTLSMWDDDEGSKFDSKA